jgi:methionine synthase II (cobalamin-independent)
VLQLDEPALPGVLRGTVPTASGFGRLRAVEEPAARDLLRRVIETAAPDGPVVVHCCAPGVPFATLRGAGASAVSVDWSLLSPRQDEELAELIEGGMMLYAGAVAALDPASSVPPGYQKVVDDILALRRIGLPARQIADAVVVTPSCGLAGASPQWAARAQRLCLDAARALTEVE